MVRFLYTSDWQLGMTRHFFSVGFQERYNQARFDVIRTLCRIAKDENCQFFAVCGDTFAV
jgi:DNA repair exonuclease SbcCD nuclease subunit